MSNGQVLKFDKFNFVGYADFNEKEYIEKLHISDGIIIFKIFQTMLNLANMLCGEKKIMESK